MFNVKQYYSSGSPTKVKRDFATGYNQDINIKAVNNEVDKWRRNGPICDIHEGNSGRPNTARTVVVNFEKRIKLRIECTCSKLDKISGYIH